MTWKDLSLALAASIGIGTAGTIFLWDRIDSRVSKDEFAEHVVRQVKWQDKVDERLERLTSRPVGVTIDGQQQNQVVLVMSPETAREVLRDQRIREHLTEMKASTNGM